MSASSRSLESGDALTAKDVTTALASSESENAIKNKSAGPVFEQAGEDDDDTDDDYDEEADSDERDEEENTSDDDCDDAEKPGEHRAEGSSGKETGNSKKTHIHRHKDHPATTTGTEFSDASDASKKREKKGGVSHKLKDTKKKKKKGSSTAAAEKGTAPTDTTEPEPEQKTCDHSKNEEETHTHQPDKQGSDDAEKEKHRKLSKAKRSKSPKAGSRDKTEETTKATSGSGIKSEEKKSKSKSKSESRIKATDTKVDKVSKQTEHKAESECADQVGVPPPAAASSAASASTSSAPKVEEGARPETAAEAERRRKIEAAFEAWSSPSKSATAASKRAQRYGHVGKSTASPKPKEKHIEHAITSWSGAGKGPSKKKDEPLSTGSAAPTPINIPDFNEDDLSDETKTFGKTISRSIELAGPGAVVPKVISDCVNRLLADCLDVEGLFRVPGGMEEVHQLRRHYDGDLSVPGVTPETAPHDVGSLLKLYFHELAEPLLTFRFYDTFIFVQKNPDLDYRKHHFRNLLNALPPANKVLLKYLAKFLLEVAKHHSTNKMDIPNLAIVFGPELLRSPTETQARLIQNAINLGWANGVIRLMLEEYDLLLEPLDVDTPQLDLDESAVQKAKADAASAAAASAAEAKTSVLVTDDESGVDLAESAFSDDQGGEEEVLQRSAAGRRRRNIRRRAVKIDVAELNWDGNPESLAAIVQQMEEDEKREQEEAQAAQTADSSLPAEREDVEGEIAFKSESGEVSIARRTRSDANVSENDILCNPRDFIENALRKALWHDDPHATDDVPLTAASSDVTSIPIENVRKEHMILKSLLMRWANAYTQKHNMSPPKEAREDLRIFYERYHALRHRLQREELDSFPPAKQLVLLKCEKKRIQVRLNQFKRAFESNSGHSVGDAQDFAPVQQMYDDYQKIKHRIALLEAASST